MKGSPRPYQGKSILLFFKCATTIQFNVVALIFTISLLSSVLTLAENTNVVVHGRDNL